MMRTLPLRFARLSRCSDGTSAVEFSLLAFPLLLMLFGCLEYGRLLWTRQALQQTAIVTARCMGLGQSGCASGGAYSPALTTATMQAQAAMWSIALNSSDLTLSNAASCGGMSGFSKAAVSYTFVSPVPALITALAGGAVLTASACFPNHL